MLDIVKKALLLGIGSVYVTKDKVKEIVDDLQKNEKITPEEGKKMVNEILEKIEKYKNEQRKDIRNIVLSVLDELGVATKNDIAKLKKTSGKKK